MISSSSSLAIWSISSWLSVLESNRLRISLNRAGSETALTSLRCGSSWLIGGGTVV